MFEVWLLLHLILILYWALYQQNSNYNQFNALNTRQLFKKSFFISYLFFIAIVLDKPKGYTFCDYIKHDD
jgi:4-hydroxybenzoate polyprenyltransferase